MNKLLNIGLFLLLLLWIFINIILYESPSDGDSESLKPPDPDTDILIDSSPEPDSEKEIDSPLDTEPEPSENPRLNHISILDDEVSINPLNLACKPESFGYSLEEASLLFPNITYPRCEEIYNSSPEMFYINRKDNTLHMNCSGKIALGVTEIEEEFGKYQYSDRNLEYGGPIVLESQEYAFGTCDINKKIEYEHVAYKLKIKEKSLERAKKSLKAKPINIVMLVFDSLSRRMFFRKLPKTVDFLNSNTKNFSVFDFKLHHVMGQNSAASYMPTFYGEMEIKQQRRVYRGDLFHNVSIWRYFHERGFVTMMGMDNCGDNLPSYIGKNPQVDHIMGSLWCAAGVLYGYNESLKKERCIGYKNVHAWMMDYILDFSDAYKNVSRYSYMHIDTAHEETGTVVSTIDLDLKNFLNDFTNRDEDYVLFLMGDHGMRYGEWFKSKDGSHEHRLPLLLTIVKNSVLENIPNSTQALFHNSNRLLSKLDFHTTLQHFANYPDMEFNKTEIRKKTSITRKTYNWFTDYIPNNRTCEDAGIPPYWCSCKAFKEINDDLNSENWKYLTNEIINNFNEDNKKNDIANKKICKKLNLKTTTYIGKLETSDADYYKIKFTIKEKDSALFEVITRLSREKITKKDSEYFNVKNITFGEMNYYNIMNVNRLDSYDGVCKEEITRRGMDPNYCICDEIDFMRDSISNTEKYGSEHP